MGEEEARSKSPTHCHLARGGTPRRSHGRTPHWTPAPQSPEGVCRGGRGGRSSRGTLPTGITCTEVAGTHRATVGGGAHLLKVMVEILRCVGAAEVAPAPVRAVLEGKEPAWCRVHTEMRENRVRAAPAASTHARTPVCRVLELFANRREPRKRFYRVAVDPDTPAGLLHCVRALCLHDKIFLAIHCTRRGT